MEATRSHVPGVPRDLQRRVPHHSVPTQAIQMPFSRNRNLLIPFASTPEPLFFPRIVPISARFSESISHGAGFPVLVTAGTAPMADGKDACFALKKEDLLSAAP